jgi:hypothetical protein
MPVIFVHGVNNRKEDAGYDAGVALTRKFLQRYLEGAQINGKTLHAVDVAFPYWGGLATTFAWNMASLPPSTDRLGASLPHSADFLIHEIAMALAADPLADQPLLALARQDFRHAVLVLSEVILLTAKPDNVEQAASLAASIQLYADHHNAPAWLQDVGNDVQFFSRLATEVAGPSPLEPAAIDHLGAIGGLAKDTRNLLVSTGIGIKQALSKVTGFAIDYAGDYASTRLLASSRRALNGVVGRFFGDVFVYLHERGDASEPGPIPALLIAAIEDAIARNRPGEPLVIIGHSLGGVVAFDLLSHFRPDLQVDLLLSVGSQISHFEEIKRFKGSDPHIPANGVALAPTPGNIRHWINVYDEVDVFSYACKRVFDRVSDHAYDTHTHTLKSHGAYFMQNQFYENLRGWLKELT